MLLYATKFVVTCYSRNQKLTDILSLSAQDKIAHVSASIPIPGCSAHTAGLIFTAQLSPDTGLVVFFQSHLTGV